MSSCAVDLPAHVWAALNALPRGDALLPLAAHAWEHCGKGSEAVTWMAEARAARWQRLSGWMLAAGPTLPLVLVKLDLAARRALSQGRPAPPWRAERWAAWASVECNLNLPVEWLVLYVAALLRWVPEYERHFLGLHSVEAEIIRNAPWRPAALIGTTKAATSAPAPEVAIAP